MTIHALTLPEPSALGSIEAFIQEVNRYPMLSEAEEVELARHFRDDGDLESARKLILSHLRLVVSVARGYLGYGISHADLIQEGNIGLMKAVKRFDPERGVRLVSFAMHWIKAEIHEYILKNWRLLKLATTKAQRKLFFNLRRKRSQFEDRASFSKEQSDQVAEQLGVKPEEVREMELRISGGELSLQGSRQDEDETDFAPIDYLADTNHEPTQVLARRATQQLETEGLQQALVHLDERSRRIIEARWLPDEKAATLHDMAAEFGVSAERIRQIEGKALQQMREILSSARQ